MWKKLSHRRTAVWLTLFLSSSGLGLGLLIGWLIWPVEYYDTDPVDLGWQDKQTYIVLVSSSYAVHGDLAQARARLEESGEEDIGSVVAELARQYMIRGEEPEVTRNLVKLAQDLGALASPELIAYVATATPTPTETPTPTVTPAFMPMPTAIPTFTPTPPPATPTPTLMREFISIDVLWTEELHDGQRYLVAMLSLLDIGLANLEIYFYPDMLVGSSYQVRLTVMWPEDLSALETRPISDPPLGFPSRAVTITDVVAAYSVMSADLTGEGLEIRALQAPMQARLMNGPTEWLWNVKPLKAGRLELTFILGIPVRIGTEDRLLSRALEDVPLQIFVSDTSPTPTAQPAVEFGAIGTATVPPTATAPLRPSPPASPTSVATLRLSPAATAIDTETTSPGRQLQFSEAVAELVGRLGQGALVCLGAVLAASIGLIATLLDLLISRVRRGSNPREEDN